MRRLFIWCLFLILCVIGCSIEGSELLEKEEKAKMNAEAAKKKTERRVPLDDTALAKVAAEGIEVDWDDVKGLSTLLGARVPIQVCHHPHQIFVHPDMSVAIDSAGSNIFDPKIAPPVIGIALEKPDGFPDMYKVTRRLHKGYLPIVESQWANDGFRLNQTVFCYLPNDPRVTTGKETQYVLMRLTVTNEGDSQRQVPFFVYLGCGGDTFVNYLPFNPVITRWAQPPLPFTLRESVLSSEKEVAFVFNSDKAVTAAFVPGEPIDSSAKDKPPALNNALHFDLNLAKGETRIIDFVIADSGKFLPLTEIPTMQKLKFDDTLKIAIERWDALLAPAMKLTTPDKRINDVFKHLALSCLSLQFRHPDSTWHVPNQSPTPGVWSWEFAHLAVPMISIGLHNEMDPSLEFFFQRQNGIGAKSANSQPRGEIESTRGSFTGDNEGRLWMNETGSILWVLASRYLYTHDEEWLKTNWKSILAAWDWIQAERLTTRINDDKGEKVRYWGLLPSGMPGDFNLYCYTFTFNDSFTYLGMSEIARAATQAGMPEADRMAKEAQEYKQCILDVIKREEFVDLETKLLFVPNTVMYRETPQDKRDPYWVADGPIQLFDTGILHPADKRFAEMVEFTRVTKSLPYSGILLGFAEHMGGNDWYPNQTERSYYRCYLGRGEIEKALLVLYSNLTYGMSNDTYQTAEHFMTDNPNYIALSPNGSGNGRNLDMIRRMMIDEQEPGKLYLLRGCPRRWFEEGQTIAVENAPTLFGKMSIKAKSEKNRITIEIETPDRAIPDAIILYVRSPKDKPLKSAAVNGRDIAINADAITLPREKGTLHVVVTR